MQLKRIRGFEDTKAYLWVLACIMERMRYSPTPLGQALVSKTARPSVRFNGAP